LKVHQELGPGFLESVYQAALTLQLRRDGMDALEQKEIPIHYSGRQVGLHRLDLVVEDSIVVEIKAVQEFNDCHLAQIISYLKASGLKTGLLLNFGQPKLKIKRVVL
jgi:GxxExxY protein